MPIAGEYSREHCPRVYTICRSELGWGQTMSHSLCTHAVMLTVFNLGSTSPRFHHPFCLQARPVSSTSVSGASSSISSSTSGSSCSFLPRFTFPQKIDFPTCSNPLSVRSPCLDSDQLHTTQSPRLCVQITRSHSSHPSSTRPSNKKTIGPCSLPQNLVVPLYWGKVKGGVVYRRFSL
jgi:hypothetical protein